jgi:hypothetical protein
MLFVFQKIKEDMEFMTFRSKKSIPYIQNPDWRWYLANYRKEKVCRLKGFMPGLLKT